jgi:hypothetical protein
VTKYVDLAKNNLQMSASEKEQLVKNKSSFVGLLQWT